MAKPNLKLVVPPTPVNGTVKPPRRRPNAELRSREHQHGNDREKHALQEIVAVESTFIESTNWPRIDEFTNRLERLRFQVLRRLPDFLTGMFEYLNERHRPSMNDPIQAKQLFLNGKRLIADQAWDDLDQVIARLWYLVPDDERNKDDEARTFTGIV
jgi:molecular chaperone DnaK